MNPLPPPSPLSPPLLRGMIVIYVFATLSTLGLVSIFLRIIYFAIHRKLASGRSVDYVFFDTQLGRYAASLLMANLLNGISGMISLRWILERKIIEGSVCTAQAIIMQIGNWGTAFFTVTIAIHTFNSLVLRWRQSTIVWTATVALGWTMSILLSILPTFHNLQFGPIYGADTDACGVRRFYPMKQFSFHLLPIFIASVLSALLYSIIFLVLRGTLVIKGGIKFTLDPHERWKMTGVSENYQRFVASIARSMLWFPIAYISLLVPYSIMRLLEIGGYHVPVAAMVLASICWFLLGIVNVLLLFNTYRVLAPAFDGRTSAPKGSAPEETSFGNLRSPKRCSSSVASGHKLLEKIQQLGYPLQASEKSPTQLEGEYIPAIPTFFPHDENPESDGRESTHSHPSTIGRPITDTWYSDEVIEPAVAEPNTTAPTSLQLSVQPTSPPGLPAPPRRSRSPIPRYPTTESLRAEPIILNDEAQAITSEGHAQRSLMSHQPSKDTLGAPKRNRSSSLQSQELELNISSWISRYGRRSSRGDGSLLSAFSTSFPSPITPSGAISPRPLPHRPSHNSTASLGVPASRPPSHQRLATSRNASVSSTGSIPLQLPDQIHRSYR